MVYTERALRRQQFHVASAIQQLNSSQTASVDIRNVPLCKLQIPELRRCVSESRGGRPGLPVPNSL